ncbi:hypothetical protein GOC13_23030 [Sinorhizobium meliloti]|nr:hypothetical protein [Sinorhizobium meliloti]MDW9984772.1 hypothetical protein [Sinorhizobium meliloti]MDX0094216.1 hypothetical protein [Sinorhizobium meliloti]MDX0270631.1 hypothetical protein [Sinorhizobium meliloti]
MGVYRTDYLMWAVDVGAKAFNWEKHEAEIEGRPDRRFDVVYDGMSGQYCMAGEIVAKSDAYEGFSPKKIDPDSVAVDRRDELALKVSQAFDRTLTADDFSLVLFSHYS